MAKHPMTSFVCDTNNTTREIVEVMVFDGILLLGVWLFVRLKGRGGYIAISFIAPLPQHPPKEGRFSLLQPQLMVID